jgi:hypothetical protein
MRKADNMMKDLEDLENSAARVDVVGESVLAHSVMVSGRC